MKDKETIKKDILNALGNPVSGVLVDHLDIIVNAVVGLQTESASVTDRPAKETRTVEAVEKR